MKKIISIIACLMAASTLQAKEIRIVSDNAIDMDNGREIIMSLDENEILTVEYCSDDRGCLVIGNPRPLSEYQKSIPQLGPLESETAGQDLATGVGLSMVPATLCLIRLSACRKLMAKMHPQARDFAIMSGVGMPVMWGIAGAYVGDAIRGGTPEDGYQDSDSLLEALEDTESTTLNYADYSNWDSASISDLAQEFSRLELLFNQ